MRDFGREQHQPWVNLVPPTRRESKGWSEHDPDAWAAAMDPVRYMSGNYVTIREALRNRLLWNTDRKLGQFLDLASARLAGQTLPDELTIGCLSTGPGHNEMLTTVALAQRLRVPIRSLTNYEPVPANREHGRDQWQASRAREHKLRAALIDPDHDPAQYRQLLAEREKSDRSWLYAQVLGIDITTIDHAGINGKPVEADWQPLDVFSPPSDMFESLDVATDFYGSCSYTDSPARFAATMITKMRMLKPGGLLVSVNEAVTGVWKGYKAALPGANVPPHVMRAILRILDPNVELESIELDTSTTDGHVPATVIMSVLQKSADFEERLPEIRQKLVDLLSLPGSFELDGMEPPRASPQLREQIANNAIVPIGAMQPFDDAPPFLLTLMRDVHGTRQVHAHRKWQGEFDPADAEPLTSLDSSVVHAEVAPGAGGMMSVVDHRGVVTLHDVVAGRERSVPAFSQSGERQLGPWSPDGRRFLVTTASIDVETGLRATEIHCVSVDNPDEPQLLLRENAADWTCNVRHSDDMQAGRTHGTERRQPIVWTEQGSLLAVRRSQGESDELWEVDPASGSRKLLVGPDADCELLLHNTEHGPSGLYERVDNPEPMIIDQLLRLPDGAGIEVGIQMPGSRQSAVGWLEVPNDAADESSTVRLWAHETPAMAERIRLEDGTVFVAQRERHAHLTLDGRFHDLNHPLEGPSAGHPRGYTDPVRYGDAVAIGDSAVFATVSPLRGPALARVQTAKARETKGWNSAYELMQTSPPTPVGSARLHYARDEENGRRTPLGRVMLPSTGAMTKHEPSLPLLIWLGGNDEMTYPAWMEQLIERYGIAVLVPDLSVPPERIASAQMSAAERHAVIEQLHRHIEAFCTQRVAEGALSQRLDGSRIMIAGDTLVSELLASYPDDAMAAAVLANADDPLPGLRETGFDGPLFVAGNSRQIGAIAPLARQWREEGRQVVTANAVNERNGRFQAADNEAALRLALTAFFAKAARRHQPSMSKAAGADRGRTIAKPTPWVPVDRPAQGIPFRGLPRIHAPGKVANRLGRGTTVAHHPDTTERKPRVTLTSHEPKRAITVEIDLDAKRATIVDIQNPPPLERRSLPEWSSLIAEALRPYDINQIEFGPTDIVPVFAARSELPYYLATAIAGAFRLRGIRHGNLYFRAEPVKDDPQDRFKIVVRRGIGTKAPLADAPANA
ncbi:MAG TPA: hypothetical protein VGL01_23205 [Trinickia sp.]|uniref:hypothetical protein n=1 Tax=Trinickia sp. TaxID=2571163 RepID=UPI002F42F142